MEKSRGAVFWVWFSIKFFFYHILSGSLANQGTNMKEVGEDMLPLQNNERLSLSYKFATLA